MSENKDYISRADELGNIHIAEEVLAAVAASLILIFTGTEMIPLIWKKEK